MQIKAPRGTSDILPGESGEWNAVERIMRQKAEQFGFREIRTPVFEHTELFQRGVGETTDIVSKEMYTFEDRGGRSITLRPENTASCVRALVEHSIFTEALPVKWFYIGSMFRYDRPQAGRLREFHQFGVEAFGSNSPYLDAEVITLMVEIIQALGIQDYELHLNSIGCPTCRQHYREKLIEFFKPHEENLCKDCRERLYKNPLRILDCKVPTCQEQIKGFPIMADYLCDDCREHYAAVKKALDINQVKYIQDDQLVRGLDYYTNTAFEIHLPAIGAQSAVGGGGRYNGLIQEIGGPDMPGIGFAMGLERLLLARDASGVERETEKPLDVFVALQNPDYMPVALELLHLVRTSGFSAVKDYQDRSMKAQMKYAGKIGARTVIVIGEDEVKTGAYTVRNMATGEQSRVAKEELVQQLNRDLR